MLASQPASRPTAAEVAARARDLAADLASRHGPFDARAYLESRFGDERDRRAAAVAAGMKEVLARAPTGPPRTEATPVADGRTPSGRVRWIGAALLLALVGTIAIATLSRSREGARNGLRAEYFADRDLGRRALVRIDPQIFFVWGTFPPAESVPEEGFSVRWTGTLIARFSEPTEICFKNDDGARLWLDDRLLIDDWSIHRERLNCASVNLVADRAYRLKIEYFQSHSLAVAQLFWQSPSISPRAPVPTSQLRPR
jgi:hypothetical protein